MRSQRCRTAVGVLLGVTAVVHAMGCDTTWDDYYNPLMDPKLADGGGGTPAACVPSENNKPVDDTCGVFVSSSIGADGNTGTKSAPLKGMQDAIDKAKGRPIYACAEAFAGSRTLASGSAIYGGLDCTKDWAYIGGTKKSALMGEPDKPALTLSRTASGAKVADFTVTAPNAMSAGASSVAVVVDGATAELDRCDLIAGDAMAGAAGTHLADDPSLDGDTGTNGAGACDAGVHTGPQGKTKMCPNGGMSAAGSGGDGGQISMMMLLDAASGTDGSPTDMSQPMKGKGGAGANGAMSCASGTDGADGADGDSGVGATGIGNIAVNGYAGVNGSDGTAGKPAQGGGGGGGAKGGLQVTCGASTVDVTGASGGSGGTGGCGGIAGGGGQAGGSSIALVTLKAMLTLTDVTLKAGKAGDGGKGGDGQSGGQKGTGGNPGPGTGGAKASCGGGRGGAGGLGGPGGGGQGGHSLGMAYMGTAPAIDMKQITVGATGKGGLGGTGNTMTMMGKGGEGVAAPMQEFK